MAVVFSEQLREALGQPGLRAVAMTVARELAALGRFALD